MTNVRVLFVLSLWDTRSKVSSSLDDTGIENAEFYCYDIFYILETAVLSLSKSKYCALRQCPKILWLRKYKPEAEKTDESAQAHMEAGSEVGALARGIFGADVDVTDYSGDTIDLSKMIANTRAEMEKETPVICEASFQYEGLFCSVDILRRENGGWAVYEVKSAAHSDREVYYVDVAYQKYVLERCGVHVTGTCLVCLNSNYIYDGILRLRELFQITDVSGQIRDAYGKIGEKIRAAQSMLENTEEPEIDLSPSCRSPYRCSFWSYCTRHLPKPSVFDLYSMPLEQKFSLYRAGFAAFEDLEGSGCIVNEKQKRQIDFSLHDKEAFIDRQKIGAYLKKLFYPLFFLDFETVMPAVPKYVGTTPYAQIPFQYSLHYVEREGGEVKHREFLAEAGTAPRRAIAERLCEDIPPDVCVIAYNKSFECTRLKELAELFPDLSAHLLNIRDHIVDLLVPFQSGWYYNRAMGGSFSIKSVLPALFPDDPELDYHNLEDIHNGGEAMNAFPAMETMDPETLARTRKNLLKYCELDTYAMVKVWEKLKEAAGN